VDGARVAMVDGARIPTVDGALYAVRAEPEGEILAGDADLTRQRAAFVIAAELIGLARRMLDMTVAYVKERKQFGVPVGSFQAVKHRLADAAMGLEFAAPAVLAAGWALEHRDGYHRDVAGAVILAADAADAMSRAAIQCHGAMGYTVEYELHRYAKRVWALRALADVPRHLDDLAEIVLEAEAGDLKEVAR
jgi:alkylation response protein AidB-like acyl-CoA dehydrogenase